MYISNIKYKCSKCGWIIEPERITRNNESWKRCTVCGHESVHSITLANNNYHVGYFSNHKDLEEY